MTQTGGDSYYFCAAFNYSRFLYKATLGPAAQLTVIVAAPAKHGQRVVLFFTGSDVKLDLEFNWSILEPK